LHFYLGLLDWTSLGSGVSDIEFGAGMSKSMLRREIIQKTPGRVNQKLRNSAQDAPHCFGCGKDNWDGHQLCLAHSNRIADGKGRGLKATDESGAILCAACHAYVDYAGPNREAMQDYHRGAHVRTLAWWKSKGLI
jgi:hypothetical protein